MVGEVIDGRYEVLGVLGRGGGGVVYRAYHRAWNMVMAIKVPHQELIDNEKAKQRFLRESQTWISLDRHPNIVQCWFVRELNGALRLFVDYFEGRSLKELISNGDVTPQDLPQILDIGIQVADGLEFAHRHDVIHRDIKPANILIAPDGRACIGDFGTVSTASFGSGSEATSHIGTPADAPAEQWVPEGVIDHRVDLYALGVVLYELLCGRRPFDDGRHLEPHHVLVGRHRDSPVPDLRRFNASLPDSLARLVTSCLEKAPDRRPASAAEVRELLANVYVEVSGGRSARQPPRAAEDRAASLNNRGVSLLEMGEVEQALAVWDEALRLDANLPEAVFNRAMLGWDLGELTDEQVVKRIEALKEASPDTLRIEALLGRVHIERHDGQSAINALKGATEGPFADSDLLTTYGDALLCVARYRDAADAYRRALAKNPENLHAKKHLELADAETSIPLVQRASDRLSPAPRCRRTFVADRNSVDCVDIAAGGRLALSWGKDRMLKIWDLERGRFRYHLGRHDEEVSAVAITPDGRFGVSGDDDDDGTLRLWDLRSGECLQAIEKDTDISALAVSGDGHRAISGNWRPCRRSVLNLEDYGKRFLYVWDLTTGACVHELEGHAEVIASVALTPDGRLALTASWDKTLRLWDAEEGICLQKLDGHSSQVQAAAISADGLLGLSGSRGGAIRLWDLRRGRCLHEFSKAHDGYIRSVALSSDGKLGISGGEDEQLKVWDLRQKRCLAALSGHSGTIIDVALSGEGHRAISAGADGTLRVWDLRSHRCSGVFEDHEKAVLCCALSLDGHVALTGGEDKTLRVWNLDGGHCSRIFGGHGDFPASARLTSDGNFALSRAADEKQVWLWDLQDGSFSAIGETADSERAHLALGRRRGLVGGEGALYRLDLDERVITPLDDEEQGPYSGVAVSGDDRVGLSAGKRLCLWNLETSERLHCLEGSAEVVALSGDGTRALTGGGNDLVLWDVGSGARLHELTGHQYHVSGVALSVDGRLGLSASYDKTLKLWDLDQGTCLADLPGHSEWIHGLSMTADARFAVSGGEDRTFRFWEILRSPTERWRAPILATPRSVQESLEIDERIREVLELAESSLAEGKYGAALEAVESIRSQDDFERHPRLRRLMRVLTEKLPRVRIREVWCRTTLRKHTEPISSLSVTPEGRFCLAGSWDRSISLWNLEEEECLFKSEELGEAAVTDVALSADAKIGVTGHNDGSVRVWDLVHHRCIQTFEVHFKRVAVAITPDGRRALSAGFDKKLSVIDLESLEIVRTIEPDDASWIRAVDLTADGKTAICGGDGDYVFVLDLTTGRCIRRFDNDHGLFSLKISDDASWAFGGARDSRLFFFDLKSGRTKYKRDVHDGIVFAVDMTPDRSFGLSACGDSTIRLWDLEKRECLQVLQRHNDEVNAAALSASGCVAVSGGEDKDLLVWEIDWELDAESLHEPEGDQASVADQDLPADGLSFRLREGVEAPSPEECTEADNALSAYVTDLLERLNGARLAVGESLLSENGGPFNGSKQELLENAGQVGGLRAPGPQVRSDRNRRALLSAVPVQGELRSDSRLGQPLRARTEGGRAVAGGDETRGK